MLNPLEDWNPPGFFKMYRTSKRQRQCQPSRESHVVASIHVAYFTSTPFPDEESTSTMCYILGTLLNTAVYIQGEEVLKGGCGG